MLGLCGPQKLLQMKNGLSSSFAFSISRFVSYATKYSIVLSNGPSCLQNIS